LIKDVVQQGVDAELDAVVRDDVRLGQDVQDVEAEDVPGPGEGGGATGTYVAVSSGRRALRAS
jgi:hypothetical protein